VLYLLKVVAQEKSLPKISVIIPTRDRPKDLAEVLLSILNQEYLPHEVIIVDGSPRKTAKSVYEAYVQKFEKANSKLKYIEEGGIGLTTGRNLGIRAAEGDAVLFLDDDVVLEKDTILTLAKFLKENPKALGIQPRIITTKEKTGKKLSERIINAVRKTLMLSYREENKLAVRRSGASIYPYPHTKTIQAQRLSGCCSCFRKEVFKTMKFDTKLKRWSYMEDLDFSYRLHKRNPGTLYAIPYTKIVHKESGEARLPSKTQTYMKTVYWYYIFFKDIYEGSLLNLIAFLWAQAGTLFLVLANTIAKRKNKNYRKTLIYLIESHIYALKNLKNIVAQNLEFFNKKLLQAKKPS